MRKEKVNCLRALLAQMKAYWSTASWVLTAGILEITIPIPQLPSQKT